MAPPNPCRCRCSPGSPDDEWLPLGVAELDDVRPGALRAWAAACHQMARAGVPPLPPPHVIRALKRRGWWPL